MTIFPLFKRLSAVLLTACVLCTAAQPCGADEGKPAKAAKAKKKKKSKKAKVDLKNPTAEQRAKAIAALDKSGIKPEQYVDALQKAADKHDAKLVRLLIIAGTDIRKADGETAPDGRTLILRSCWSPKCTKMLLEAGADPNKSDKEGRLPLPMILDPLDNYYLMERKADVYKVMTMLVKAGADVNNKGDWSFDFPLSSICCHGEAEHVKLLLDAGAKVNAVNTEYHRSFPLSNAVRNDKTDIVKLLLAAGADVNHADEDGDTALHSAAYTRNAECVKLLIEAKADVNKKNKKGLSPLDIVTERKCTEIAEILKQAGAK